MTVACGLPSSLVTKPTKFTKQNSLAAGVDMLKPISTWPWCDYVCDCIKVRSYH